MKQFFRKSNGKILFGVCSSLGYITKVDPLIWRLIFVGLIFTPFPVIALYIIATFITPSIETTD